MYNKVLLWKPNLCALCLYNIPMLKISVIRSVLPIVLGTSHVYGGIWFKFYLTL